MEIVDEEEHRCFRAEPLEEPGHRLEEQGSLEVGVLDRRRGREAELGQRRPRWGRSPTSSSRSVGSSERSGAPKADRSGA